MRKVYVVLMLAGLCCGCAKEEFLSYEEERVPVIVRAAIAESDETRANPLSDTLSTQTAFNSGDVLMISDDGSAFLDFTLTDGEWQSSGSYLTWDNMAFYAYYPQSAQYHLYDLVTTQTLKDDFLSADYMRWSKTYTAIPSDFTVDIEMARQTARVRVKVSINDETGTNPYVNDYHIYSPHVAIRHGTPIGSTAKVSPYVEENSDGDTEYYTALVIPYSDDDTTTDFEDEYFLDFGVCDTYNGSTRTTTVYYKGIPELKASYTYTINVTITLDN